MAPITPPRRWITRLLACALLAFAPVVVLAAETATPAAPSLRLAVEMPRTSWRLGETPWAHFVVTNTGKQPVTLRFPRLNRGANRELSYHVRVNDEHGDDHSIPDNGIRIGGGVGEPVVAPGESYRDALPLIRYARLPGPGRYTFRVSHSLGLATAAGDWPSASITLDLAMPTPAEAAEIFAAAIKRPPGDYEGATDHYGFDWPVYLDLLRDHIGGGGDNVAYLYSLGGIATPAATRALLELARHSSPQVAHEAARQLDMRLDSPEGEPRIPPIITYVDSKLTRAELAASSWDDHLRDATHQLALEWVGRRDDITRVDYGARFLAYLGRADDGPLLMQELSVHLSDSKLATEAEGSRAARFPITPHDPVMNLSKALEHLRHRGFTPSEDLHDEAAAYLYFKRLADQPEPRPADWLARLRTVAGLDPWPGPSGPPYWFQTDYRSRQANATIRAAAIGSIPRPMPPECRPVLLHALAAFDSRVSKRAAVVAEYSKDPSLVPVLLEAMRGEPDSYLARAFFSAIEHLNPSEPERLDALADRILLDERAGHYVIAELIRRLAAPDPGWPESQSANRLERARLHAAWKDFLSTHRTDIAAGRRYSLAAGELPAALFGATCVYTLPDGTRWPPSATVSQQ